MKTQIELESVKEKLTKIKTVMAINGIPNKNHEAVIIAAVNIAYTAISDLDEETLINVFNLKKSI